MVDRRFVLNDVALARDGFASLAALVSGPLLEEPGELFPDTFS